MIPPTSCNHHTSISCRAAIDWMMSNAPAKTRKKRSSPLPGRRPHAVGATHRAGRANVAYWRASLIA